MFKGKILAFPLFSPLKHSFRPVDASWNLLGLTHADRRRDMKPPSILKGSQKHNTHYRPVPGPTLAHMKHSVSFSIPPAAPEAKPIEEPLDEHGVQIHSSLVAGEMKENLINPSAASSPAFLISPLETLLQSIHDQENLHLTQHDIIEAYAALSMRFRSLIAEDAQIFASPILNPIKSHSSELAGCLKRDIKRAFRNPFTGFHQASVQDSVYSVDSVAEEDELQYALDLSMLCHHALRVVSDIFASPLYTIFSGSYSYCCAMIQIKINAIF